MSVHVDVTFLHDILHLCVHVYDVHVNMYINFVTLCIAYLNLNVYAKYLLSGIKDYVTDLHLPVHVYVTGTGSVFRL